MRNPCPSGGTLGLRRQTGWQDLEWVPREVMVKTFDEAEFPSDLCRKEASGLTRAASSLWALGNEDALPGLTPSCPAALRSLSECQRSPLLREVASCVHVIVKNCVFLFSLVQPEISSPWVGLDNRLSFPSLKSPDEYSSNAWTKEALRFYNLTGCFFYLKRER